MISTLVGPLPRYRSYSMRYCKFIFKKEFSVLVVLAVIMFCAFHYHKSSKEVLVLNHLIHESVSRDVELPHKDFGVPKQPAERNLTLSSIPVNISSTTKTSTSEEISGLTVEQTNPGCTYRRLKYYVPQRAPTVYNHPPLVHYAKFASGKMTTLNYMEYMSMLSAYKFLKPERILIHTDVEIHGKYWDRTQGWSGTTVEVNRVSRVGQFGGKRVRYVEHEADYVKLRQLYKYGGITSDFDVLIVNGTKLKEQQRVSECVLSREGNIVNIGFNSCIKNSSFIRLVLEGYETDYRPNSWLHNSALLPTDILRDKQRKCFNVYLDGTICLNPNSAQASTWWLSPNGVDWRKKTVAHYFVKDGYPKNDELLKADHSLAELFRYVTYS